MSGLLSNGVQSISVVDGKLHFSNDGEVYIPMPESEEVFNNYNTYNGYKLMEDTTINLDPSMDAATIQGLIDMQPKNLNNNKLTIQFADGVYVLDEILSVSGFLGVVEFTGNANDVLEASLTKSVTLDFSSVLDKGLRVYNNVDATLRNISIKTDCQNSSFGVDMRYNIGVRLYGVTTINTNNTTSFGLFNNYGFVSCVYCMTSGYFYGCYTSLGNVLLVYCVTDSNNIPAYGAASKNGGHMGLSVSTLLGYTANSLRGVGSTLVTT